MSKKHEQENPQPVPEVDPKNQIVLTEWEKHVNTFFCALFPGLYIQTLEERRAIKSLVNIIQWLGINRRGSREVLVWSDCSLKDYKLFKEGASKEDADEEYQIENKTWVDFLTTVTEFAKTEGTSHGKPKHNPKTLIICDAGKALEDAANRRALRETLQEIAGSRKTIVLIGKTLNLAPELQHDIIPIEMKLPTDQEMYDDCYPRIKDFSETPKYKNEVQIEWDAIAKFCRACTGISMDEVRRLTSLALAKYRNFDSRAISLALEEKKRIIARSDVATYVEPKAGMEKVGGLQNLKSWLVEQEDTFKDISGAREYGIKIPSGVLMVGVQGSGKSLSSYCLGKQWNLPIIHADLGRFFGSLLGESEGRFRQFIAICEACKPCVVVFDELEKGIGGGDLDGGTASRIMGSLLTWLQNKSDEIFVCATANNLRALAKYPELVRRFDKTFFVDLPDLRSRIEIMNIHLSDKHPGCIKADDLVDIARECKGFSGDEIAKSVQDALRLARKDKLPHPAKTHMLAAMKARTPLSVVMKEPIAILRQWCRDSKITPAGGLIEDEKHHDSDEKSLESFGIPDCLPRDFK